MSNSISFKTNKRGGVSMSASGLGARSLFNALVPSDKKILRDGEPCGHHGCLKHISHPCEGCGRIVGRKVGEKI